MTDITTKLFGETLVSPVIPASGTFGFGREFAELYDLNCLGSIALKGCTVEARYGNPLPRIAECPAGLLNAIGLQNPSAKKVISEEIPRLAEVYRGKVIANVGGHSVEDYVEAASLFNNVDKVLCVELNISCPNVKGGGMAFGTSPKIAEKLVYKVKKACTKPLLVKLSPNVTDITELARAVEDGGADGISLINTLVGARIDLRTKRPILSTTTGGYSGPGVFPVAVGMVYRVAKAVSLPVVGMGGISCAEDVLEMVLAGASAVMVGSANLVDPCACKNIISALPAVLKKYGVDKLSAAVGGAL